MARQPNLIPDANPAPEAEAAPEAASERMVRVKCVVHNKPWAAGQPMYFWRDYDVPASEADVLDGNHQAVIIGDAA